MCGVEDDSKEASGVGKQSERRRLSKADSAAKLAKMRQDEADDKKYRTRQLVLRRLTRCVPGLSRKSMHLLAVGVG